MNPASGFLRLIGSGIFVFYSFLSAADFPNTVNQADFDADMLHVTILSTVPRIGQDHGSVAVALTNGSFFGANSQWVNTQGLQLAIQANEEYAFWARLSHWPGTEPAFGVGIGFQYRLVGIKNWAQDIGVTWHQVRAVDYFRERDVSAFYSVKRKWQRTHAGLYGHIILQNSYASSGLNLSDSNRNTLGGGLFVIRKIHEGISLQIFLPFTKDSIGFTSNLELSLDF